MLSRRSLLNRSLGLLTLGIGSKLSAVRAAAPFRPQQAPGYYRFYLGRYEVTSLSDGTIPLDFGVHYRNISPEKVRAALDAAFRTTPTPTSVNAFLVNTGERLILIDAGTGSYLGDSLGYLMRNIEASGYNADDIDDVILTHIHTDHSGGLSKNGERLFTNATLHVNAREYRFWLETPEKDRPNALPAQYFTEALESLSPYIDAKRVETFADNGDVLPGIGSILRPGHTPGHSSIVLKDAGKILVFWGDITHGDVLQFDEPEVAIEFDVDKDAAVRTRELALAEAADIGYLVAGAHIAFPGIGNVRRDDTNFGWVPTNYANI